jgi:hypothetical protein
LARFFDQLAEDPRQAAAVLDGFAILKPCLDWQPSGMANNGELLLRRAGCQ